MVRRLPRINQENLPIICALICCMVSVRELYRHQKMIVDMPIANRSQFSTKFKTDLRGLYTVQVDLKNYPKGVFSDAAPPIVLSEITGKDSGRVERFAWEREYYKKDSFGYTIAHFDGVPGQMYSMACKVTYKNVDFDKLEPRLQVRPAPEALRQAYAFSKFLVVVSVTGLMITLASAFQKPRLKKQYAEKYRVDCRG